MRALTPTHRTTPDYMSDKIRAKERLQPRMRELLGELQKPNVFRAFLNKALFDGGNADYLSIYPGPARDDKDDKVFHMFHKDEVVDSIAGAVKLRNSKARHAKQMDDQKVIFWSIQHQKNIGEIEDRHDSRGHYREMKFRLNAKMVFEILTTTITERQQARPQVYSYGTAVRLFK